MKRTTGEDNVSNQFTDGDPGNAIPATVVDSDHMNVMQEELCSVIEGAGLVLDQSNPYPANDTTQLRQAIQILAGGGGGGGGFQLRPSEDANSAQELFDNGLPIFQFDFGIDQKINGYFKVPTGYTVGKQIRLNIAFYCSLTSGTVHMRSVSTLLRKNTDAITSTTNQRTSTNTAQTLASPANCPREAVLDLTDTSGQINGVAVNPGDVIKIEISRNNADTANSPARVLASGSEIRII